MTKTKFDPYTVQNLQPTELPPLDFMRPIAPASVPAPDLATPATTAAPTAAPSGKQRPEAPATAPGTNPKPTDLPMPPARQVEVRIPIGARIRLQLSERLRNFVRDQDVTMQDTIELAIDEFLSRRSENRRTGAPRQ